MEEICTKTWFEYTGGVNAVYNMQTVKRKMKEIIKLNKVI